eukprot:TRINITY_DN664_c1_g3_i1.p1 TRINITY_DN664_c1_g3~~TRINITY_DN664_c1_g3_i1.p1  ORF type:complete len:227 (-),score=75.21 TRINITY_DN664_c1_g3_i1:289-969(-)
MSEIVVKFDPNLKKKVRELKRERFVLPKKSNNDNEVVKKIEKKSSNNQEKNENVEETNNVNSNNENEDQDQLYEYEFLLNRIFDILKNQNPDLLNSDARGKSIKTYPKVSRSTKKTSWNNFEKTVNLMERPIDHFLNFTLSELGTTGTLDGNHRLVIRGRFNPTVLQNVQNKYIQEYITCKNCKSNETLMTKENRLSFVKCKICGSTRTVSAVKAGPGNIVQRRKR